MSRSPSISIAMATYNGAAFVQEQLDSLAAQTRLPDELIVSDDGSTDDTAAIVEQFARDAPFPVRFYRNPAPLGYGENFIQAAQRCTGEWIAFCDQDDVWSADKLQYCAEEIARGPGDLALIAHNATITDGRLHPLRPLYDYPVHQLAPPLTLPPEWHCLGLTQVFRASLVREIPADRRPSFPWHPHREAHDVWIALLANVTGTILQTNRSFALYRRHVSSVTQTEPDSAARRLREQLRGHGDDYRLRARYLHEVASLLRDRAKSAPAYSERLRLAAEKIERQAGNLRLRATIYCAREFSERLRAFTSLVGNGGYAGGSAWPFGVRRMLKDLGYAIVASRRP